MTNETLSDIVAALRHNSKGLMFYFRKEENGSTHAMGVDYVELADRIEAAWRRERVRLMAEPGSWEECVIRAKESWNDVY